MPQEWKESIIVKVKGKVVPVLFLKLSTVS
jgi:hypothetical protein